MRRNRKGDAIQAPLFPARTNLETPKDGTEFGRLADGIKKFIEEREKRKRFYADKTESGLRPSQEK